MGETLKDYLSLLEYSSLIEITKEYKEVFTRKIMKEEAAYHEKESLIVLLEECIRESFKDYVSCIIYNELQNLRFVYSFDNEFVTSSNEKIVMGFVRKGYAFICEEKMGGGIVDKIHIPREIIDMAEFLDDEDTICERTRIYSKICAIVNICGSIKRSKLEEIIIQSEEFENNCSNYIDECIRLSKVVHQDYQMKFDYIVNDLLPLEENEIDGICIMEESPKYNMVSESDNSDINNTWEETEHTSRIIRELPKYVGNIFDVRNANLQKIKAILLRINGVGHETAKKYLLAIEAACLTNEPSKDVVDFLRFELSGKKFHAEEIQIEQIRMLYEKLKLSTIRWNI